MEVSQARVLLLSSVATLGLGVTSLDAKKSAVRKSLVM